MYQGEGWKETGRKEMGTLTLTLTLDKDALHCALLPVRVTLKRPQAEPSPSGGNLTNAAGAERAEG